MSLLESTSININRKWYVLFTIPKHEKKICEKLKMRGINAFVPMQKEIRQWSDRKKKVEVPYFPNYVFVKIPTSERFKIFEVPGIIRYLDSNQNPTIMLDSEIEIIKKLTENGTFEISTEKFKRGDNFKITSGPLMNLSGELVDVKGKRRLILEIKSIKRNLLVELSPECLAKCSNTESAYKKQLVAVEFE